MTDGIVIAGGGLAAQRCAEALRRTDYDGPIRMICAEPHRPYDRPPLSKAYLRGELRLKPKQPAPPRALAMTELALKYVVYALGGVTAFVGGVQALPPQDQGVKDTLSGLIRPEQWTSALLILGGAVLLAVILERVATSLFEDVKKRSRKFSAKAVDQLKSAARVAMFLVIGVTALFLLLNLVLDPARLLVFSVGFIALAILVAVAGMQTLQDAIAGLNLMMA